MEGFARKTLIQYLSENGGIYNDSPFEEVQGNTELTIWGSCDSVSVTFTRPRREVAKIMDDDQFWNYLYAFEAESEQEMKVSLSVIGS